MGFISIIISISSVIISLIAIGLSWYTYKQSQKIQHDIYKKQKSDRETSKVIEFFMKLYNSSPKKDTGISALRKSGIADLQNEADAVQVIKELENRTKKNPLGKNAQKIVDDGILKHFKNSK